MEQTTKVFMDYAAAFEQTFVDDDWSRLTQYFSEDASYEEDHWRARSLAVKQYLPA